MSRSMRHFWLALGLPLALATAIVVPACGGGGGGGGAPFQITLRNPDIGAIDTGRSIVIYIRFNRTLNGATVNNTNITLNDGADVPCAVTYLACKAEIRMVPSGGPLASDTTHTVTVNVGLQDSSNNPFPAVATWTFKTLNTGDSTPPGAAGATVATVASPTSVNLTWSASSDGTATYQIFYSTTSGCFDFALAPQDTDVAGQTTETITGLTPNTVYYFVVRAIDAAGNVDTNTAEQTATTLVSWSVNVFPMLNSNCSSCHRPGGDADDEGVDLRFDSIALSYASMIDMDPVCPGGVPAGVKLAKSGGGTAATDDSFVLNKTKSKIDNVAPWCGDAMPQTGGALSNAEYQLLFDWIFQGALNN